MKIFYRSINLFIVAFVAVVGFNAQAQAKQVCFDVVAAAIGESCNVDADCDNGIYCDGIESCSTETSVCLDSTGDPCAEGETCNEDTDTCDAAPACTVDADCDDTNLCTTDTCVEGECVNADVDCGDDICNEADGACVECLIADDCAAEQICEDNVCIDDACPAGTPEKVLEYDEDGDCLLNKDELKTYSNDLKAQQKEAKDDLKVTQTEEKNEYKIIKKEYSTK